jgi:hypothetical protein
MGGEYWDREKGGPVGDFRSKYTDRGRSKVRRYDRGLPPALEKLPLISVYFLIPD